MLRIISKTLLVFSAILLTAAGCGNRFAQDQDGEVAGLRTRNRVNQVNTNGITQPAQANNDLPGGARLAHSDVNKNSYGNGVTKYWIFEPAAPVPDSAPVVVFTHGWGAMDPGTYGAWLEHLVRRGNIVIYPVYQDSFRTPTNTFTDNTLVAVKAAYNELNSGSGHVKPQWDRFAIVGHSVGGLLAANLASLATANGLPEPKAVMSVEPGKTWTLSERSRVSLVNLSGIPAKALMLVVVGDQDTLVKDVDGKNIFKQVTQIPLRNRDFVIAQSDSHGTQAIVANHGSPTGQSSIITKQDAGASESQRQGILARRLRDRLAARKANNTTEGDEQSDVDTAEPIGVDVLDYNGYWKLFDGLTDAAFYNKNREYALGGTSQQTLLGQWSDGVAIKPLKVTKRP